MILFKQPVHKDCSVRVLYNLCGGVMYAIKSREAASLSEIKYSYSILGRSGVMAPAVMQCMC